MYWKPNDSSQHKEKLHVILERGWRYQGNRERSAVIPKYISLSITIHLTSISKRERRKSYFLRSPCQSCRPRPTTRVDAAGSPWNRVPPCTDSNPGLIILPRQQPRWLQASNAHRNEWRSFETDLCVCFLTSFRSFTQVERTFVQLRPRTTRATSSTTTVRDLDFIVLQVSHPQDVQYVLIGNVLKRSRDWSERFSRTTPSDIENPSRDI